jgi:hypothetical protein
MPNRSFTDRMKELQLKQLLILFFILIIFFGALFGIYTYRQTPAEPAEIVITSPDQVNGTYTNDTIVVEGQTNKNIPVKVNEVETTSDENGNFRVEVPLELGENVITVEVGEGSEFNSTSFIIFREAPEVVTPDEKKDDIITEDRLNGTGPETLWLPEIAIISGSVLIYLKMRKRFSLAIRK